MRFATVIVRTATTASTGGHPAAHDDDFGSPNAVSRMRSIMANAPLLTAPAMYVVAGVGAPSYASGVHMWNGTALNLNPSPRRTSARARITLGFFAAPPLSAAPIPLRSVCPVAPYRNAKP